jgi:hypothetical protein
MLAYRRLALHKPARRAEWLAQPDPTGRRAQLYERLRAAFNAYWMIIARGRARQKRAAAADAAARAAAKGDEDPRTTARAKKKLRLIDMFPADVKAQLERYRTGRNAYRRHNLHLAEQRAAFVANDDRQGTKSKRLARILFDMRTYMKIYNDAARAARKKLRDNVRLAAAAGEEDEKAEGDEGAPGQSADAAAAASPDVSPGAAVEEKSAGRLKDEFWFYTLFSFHPASDA